MEAAILDKVKDYPEAARARFETLRQMIHQIAQEQQMGNVTETLKWGEPSFLVKGGTTVRLDWKSKTPEVFYIFVHCQTRVIDTCKEIYPTELQYQGNRAIVLPMDTPINRSVLLHCLQIALNYHRWKGGVLEHRPFKYSARVHR